jgi:hypothetical protein
MGEPRGGLPENLNARGSANRTRLMEVMAKQKNQLCFLRLDALRGLVILVSVDSSRRCVRCASAGQLLPFGIEALISAGCRMGRR